MSRLGSKEARERRHEEAVKRQQDYDKKPLEEKLKTAGAKEKAKLLAKVGTKAT